MNHHPIPSPPFPLMTISRKGRPHSWTDHKFLLDVLWERRQHWVLFHQSFHPAHLLIVFTKGLWYTNLRIFNLRNQIQCCRLCKMWASLLHLNWNVPFFWMPQLHFSMTPNNLASQHLRQLSHRHDRLNCRRRGNH